ncbi:MAG: hypothetical protein ACRDXX_14920 [Stackebrandtia sp.]
MTARHRHRVLITAPWKNAAGAGGCCGGDLRGVALEWERHRHEPEEEGPRAGEAVAALRAAVSDDVDVQLVDARNVVLLGMVFGDARRAGASVSTALTSCVRATTPWALVVDGEVVSRSTPLTPEAAVALLPPSVSVDA